MAMVNLPGHTVSYRAGEPVRPSPHCVRPPQDPASKAMATVGHPEP